MIYLDKTRLFAVVVAIICVTAPQTNANEKKPKLGDLSDGNRSVPVHTINLYEKVDEEKSAQPIRTDDDLVLPFSPRYTCRQCHDYEKISSGWHFNALDANAQPGRPGEPWIFVDREIGAQIPLSYRNWPGTFKPDQIGMTPWQFTLMFGRHTPGGGAGEIESKDTDEIMRGIVSGKLEVNCLSCHDAAPTHDQTEYANQIGRQNFRWAAAASCDFATVRGSARGMFNTYDPLMPRVRDDSQGTPPSISYDKNRFDAKDRVFFDITKRVPAQRCYFCHSTKTVGHETWETDQDVHITAGLTCVDCHRHGLDHIISRGYEGESKEKGKSPSLASLTCRGCHLGDKSADKNAPPIAGRLGAPRPLHKGIPQNHFEQLTCTACHSGSWPTQKPYFVKTSQAHALGTFGTDKSDRALPIIQSTVFSAQADGKIGTSKLIWPAYWGRMTGDEVSPMAVDEVKDKAGEVLTTTGEKKQDGWSALTKEQIAKALKILAGDKDQGQTVYITGGKLYRLGSDGKLTWDEEHKAAGPYTWPMAHNVRPAIQALGTHGCDDCHITSSPFFYGQVIAGCDGVSPQTPEKQMVDFQGHDPFYVLSFNLSFIFRPMLKVVSIASCLLVAAVLLLYGLRGLFCILKLAAGYKIQTAAVDSSELRKPTRLLAIFQVLILAGVLLTGSFLAITGFYAFLIAQQPLSGYLLMLHCTAAPVFAVCMAVLTLFWSHRCRFSFGIDRRITISEIAQKTCFWLIAMFLLPVTMSIVLSMFPIFGTDGQVFLYHLHRYSTLLLTIFAIIYFVSAAMVHKQKQLKT
jgi:hypothetical protein